VLALKSEIFRQLTSLWSHSYSTQLCPDIFHASFFRILLYQNCARYVFFGLKKRFPALKLRNFAFRI
jgi:hypothetical protein